MTDHQPPSGNRWEPSAAAARPATGQPADEHPTAQQPAPDHPVGDESRRGTGDDGGRFGTRPDDGEGVPGGQPSRPTQPSGPQDGTGGDDDGAGT